MGNLHFSLAESIFAFINKDEGMRDVFVHCEKQFY